MRSAMFSDILRFIITIVEKCKTKAEILETLKRLENDK
jgi:hypothetical protein